MGPTQHLIGTQLVDIESITFDSDCQVTDGRASMESYVQAWHDTTDEQVWLFIGTYLDEVVFTRCWLANQTYGTAASNGRDASHGSGGL